MKRILVLTLSLFLLYPVLAFAQINNSVPFSFEDDLQVEVVPSYPKPNEIVWLNLAIYTTDLDSADIGWYRNGKQEVLGKGLKQYSFRNGNAGETTSIEIRVRLQDGTVFSKKLSFAPAEVDLLWEADSYVPPFYRGKALHPRQGKLRVVAMPNFTTNGKVVPASKLIYEWSDGMQVYQSQSGYGRNVLSLNGSILGSTEQIQLTVRDPNSSLIAQSFLDVPTTDPELLFYRNDPYYGLLLDNAITEPIALTSQEVEVFASPFYITKELGSALKYNWTLNGQVVPELSNSRTAIFRKPESGSGRSDVRVEVKNENKILQFTDSRITINFGE